jgi:hypothetical protein
MKAVQVPNEERRFFMLEAIRKHYTQADWSAMWALVKDPSFQYLFYQYLTSLDTNIIHKGQAPMTAFKTRVQARHAPEAIKFMKALLVHPALMQKSMTDLSDSEHMAIRDEFESKGRFLIKSRPNVESPAFANLAEEAEWERFQLGKDLHTRRQGHHRQKAVACRFTFVSHYDWTVIAGPSQSFLTPAQQAR